MVVVAIIALLLSMLMPAVSSARKQAMTVKCAVQMRSIHTGLVLYAQDHRNYLPGPTFSAIPNGSDDRRVLHYLLSSEGGSYLSGIKQLPYVRPWSGQQVMGYYSPSFDCPANLDSVEYACNNSDWSSPSHFFGYPELPDYKGVPKKLDRLSVATEAKDRWLMHDAWLGNTFGAFTSTPPHLGGVNLLGLDGDVSWSKY